MPPGRTPLARSSSQKGVTQPHILGRAALVPPFFFQAIESRNFTESDKLWSGSHHDCRAMHHPPPFLLLLDTFDTVQGLR